MFLALAFGMLVWGQTVLKSRLEGVAYLVYWTICFLLTFLAMFTALLDIMLVRRKSRRDRRDLLQKTIVDLQTIAEEDEPGKEPGQTTR